jgi:hypothetical protein
LRLCARVSTANFMVRQEERRTGVRSGIELDDFAARVGGDGGLLRR